MAKPLNDLLKKDQFQWSPIADKAFQAPKCALTAAPVLALPDFSKLVVVEMDASLYGIGCVKARRASLAFISRALGQSGSSC